MATIVGSSAPANSHSGDTASSKKRPSSARPAGFGALAMIVSPPPVAEGRLELLWYVQEQSVSDDYHRYGNLGVRSNEPRTEPL